MEVDQIAFALKQAELGISVEEVCRKMGISDATFCVWRKKYSGVGPSCAGRARRPCWAERRWLATNTLAGELMIDECPTSAPADAAREHAAPALR